MFSTYKYLALVIIIALTAVTYAANMARAQETYLPHSYIAIQGQGFENVRNGAHTGTGQRQINTADNVYNNQYRAMPQRSHQMMRDRFATLSVPESEMMDMIALMNATGKQTTHQSLLEQSYSKRIIDPLSQFGYELFAHNQSSYQNENYNAEPPDTRSSPYQQYPYSTDTNQRSYDQGYQDALRKRDNLTRRGGIPGGRVQDDFILSAGDRLEIIFRGQTQSRNVYTINNEGMLIVEYLPPITASGRTFAQVRDILEDYAKQQHNTDIFVSLDSVRQIDVLIVGHVERPGRQILTVFHGVLDALMEAGGIQETGSLRQIKLIRDGRSTMIDLYGLLMHGSTAMDLQLRDGDRIVVPPIGPTIAVTGNVKRPGIYELRPSNKDPRNDIGDTAELMSLNEVLDMAGGLISAGQNRYLKLSLTSDGREIVQEISNQYSAKMNPVFGNSDILKVSPSEEMRSGTVELTGHTRQPGMHDYRHAGTLTQLISSEQVLGPDIYPLIGVIERWDKEQFSPHYLPFPPLMVVKDRFDRKLEEGDIVHLFSRKQILALQNNEADGPSGALSKTNNSSTQYKSAQYVPQHMNAMTPAAGDYTEYGSSDYNDTQDNLRDPVLIAFLTERSAFIRGAIRQAGAYPVTEGVNLENVIAVAGGLTLEANTTNIEVTSALLGKNDQAYGRSGTERQVINFMETRPETVMLEPGDTVRVNQKFKKISDESVQIIGEVMHPGRYDLVAGDKLSDLFRRAGGLTEQAYPKGAIFSRASARRAEEMRFRNAARDLKRSMAAAINNQENTPSTMQIAMTGELISELSEVEAVGRITVEADPAVLVIDPAQDLLLEAGDRIFIPKRPLTVRVTGEVLSPAILQFRDNKEAGDYIAEAGGYTFNADKGRSFVLYPDGSAEPLVIGMWNHKSVKIPPGSTVVVPHDPEPFNFIQTAKDFSQILSNLAITGIFLDDIRDN